MKKTEWFSDQDKPTLPGVYETKLWMDDSEPSFQKWNGRYWGRTRATPLSAKQAGRTKSIFQEVYWRGLASDPSKAGSKA